MPDSLAELRSAIETIGAERSELLLQVRRGELVEVARLERGIVERAHAVREQLQFSPVRHAASLAAAHGLDPATLLAVLMAMMRSALTEISRGPPGARDPSQP